MPDLDVSEILSDPDFADTVTIIRRDEHVDNNGRSQTLERKYPGTVAVVTMAAPNDLNRLDVGQIFGAAIKVTTTFRMRGSAEGFQPDQIVWDGGVYTVKALDKYHRFGAGFTSAVAISMNASTPPAS